MPNHNGLELLNHLLKNHPHVVRVVLSGTVDQRRALKAINDCQVFRCLEKPCSRELLVDSVHAALDRYEELRQSERLLDVLRMQANFIRYQDEQAQLKAELKVSEDEE
jgi:DNA-binding NtrC family response regulator